MSAVCPACGVAVVSGYIRCPKCHIELPSSAAHTRRSMAEPGGTALAHKGSPVSAVVVAVGVAAVIILVFGMRGSSKKPEAALRPPVPIEAMPPGPPPRLAPPGAAPAPAALEPPAPDPAAGMADLERTLRQRRLWGRVEITGQRVDVRSGSCGDPAMQPAIDGETSLLRSAGLTKLRCLEQSGAVVFERDL